MHFNPNLAFLNSTSQRTHTQLELLGRDKLFVHSHQEGCNVTRFSFLLFLMTINYFSGKYPTGHHQWKIIPCLTIRYSPFSFRLTALQRRNWCYHSKKLVCSNGVASIKLFSNGDWIVFFPSFADIFSSLCCCCFSYIY